MEDFINLVNQELDNDILENNISKMKKTSNYKIFTNDLKILNFLGIFIFFVL